MRADKEHDISTEGKGSEVARLLTQIAAEYEAAQRGLSGIAEGTARHAFISASYERMGELGDKIEEMVGARDVAWALIGQQLDRPQATI